MVGAEPNRGGLDADDRMEKPGAVGRMRTQAPVLNNLILYLGC